MVIFLVNTFGGYVDSRRRNGGAYFYLGIRRCVGSSDSSGIPRTDLVAGSGIFCGDFCTFIFH